MKPTISFHGIKKIELENVRVIKRDHDTGYFAVRTLTLTDEKGEKFEMKLFSDYYDCLLVGEEGHIPVDCYE